MGMNYKLLPEFMQTTLRSAKKVQTFKQPGFPLRPLTKKLEEGTITVQEFFKLQERVQKIIHENGLTDEITEITQEATKKAASRPY